MFVRLECTSRWCLHSICYWSPTGKETLEEFYYLVMGIQYPNIFAIARERECVYFAYDVAARS